MIDTTIKSLGECRIPSPLRHMAAVEAPFKMDDRRVLHDNTAPCTAEGGERLSFEVAGPREAIYFDPTKTTAAIVTCGGLCPGLNDVIRGLVTQLTHQYGVPRVYGFRYGYEGLIQRYGHTPLVLKAESVSEIHNFGGTILGSSRVPQSVVEMVDLLEEMRIDI